MTEKAIARLIMLAILSVATVGAIEQQAYWSAVIFGFLLACIIERIGQP